MSKISIGLPVYNGENYLELAIQSILTQTFTDFELIISDNASTDRTAEICRRSIQQDQRIRYFRNDTNIGAAKNYNLVFELARGQYFKWASHDDIIAPTYLERCLEVLENESDVVLCFPRISYIDAQGKVYQAQRGDISLCANRPGRRMHDFVSYGLKSPDIFWAIFGLIRKETLGETELIGSYNASDQTTLVQLLLRGKMYQVSDYLYFRREHSNASMTKFKTERERLAWFDPSLKKKIVWAHWKLLIKFIESVRNSKLKSWDKMHCQSEIFRRYLHEWRTLGGEFKIILKQLAGKE
jgi:glycosyltransferase involved in cell wall biosynthesis